MHSYDAEQHILRQKEMARRAGDTYPTVSHLSEDNQRGPAHRRALAGVGGRLVALGHRLQGEIDHLAPAAPSQSQT